MLFFVGNIDLYQMFFAAGSIIVLIGMLYKIIPLRITHHVFYFIIMNAALILGFIKFIGGIKSAVWSRTEREDAVKQDSVTEVTTIEKMEEKKNV
jgi:hypothetical protein